MRTIIYGSPLGHSDPTAWTSIDHRGLAIYKLRHRAMSQSSSSILTDGDVLSEAAACAYDEATPDMP